MVTCGDIARLLCPFSLVRHRSLPHDDEEERDKEGSMGLLWDPFFCFSRFVSLASSEREEEEEEEEACDGERVAVTSHWRPSFSVRG